MRIYFDICCLNRPFDCQAHFRIRIESEAKLYVQDLVRQGVLELAWSYVLDYENNANPFKDRREAVESWRGMAICDVDEEPAVVDLAKRYANLGLKPLDSLHVASAVVGCCDAFLTTDQGILVKRNQISEIKIFDPPTFLREMT